AEHIARELLGKLGLAGACRSQEQEYRGGAAFARKAETEALDPWQDAADRGILSADPFSYVFLDLLDGKAAGRRCLPLLLGLGHFQIFVQPREIDAVAAREQSQQLLRFQPYERAADVELGDAPRVAPLRVDGGLFEHLRNRAKNRVDRFYSRLGVGRSV